jgi:choline dehydrogenase-like flavoprotein
VILDPATVDADLTLTTDVCIVGSGAGGAMAARELTAAGRSVVVVEEGRYVRREDVTQREDEMYPRLYREHGTKATADYTVLVSQGRALGGSTIPGSCLCFRPPAPVLRAWESRARIDGIGPPALEPFVRTVEATLGIERMRPEQINRNNEKLKLGSQRLGYRGGLAWHNRVDCLGCGYCAIGCAYERKNDALISCLAPASAGGAVILPECRVEAILTEGGEATGVRALFLRSRTGTRYALTVRARVVLLCAGALGSPRLWMRSGLPDVGAQVGRHLRVHPHIAVAGVFADEVASWQGVPQSYVVDEFLPLERRVDGGYLITAAWAHPVAAAAMLPAFGATHRSLMARYPHLAVAGVYLNDRTEGRVELDDSGFPVVTYHPGQEDQEELLDAIRRVADIFFAAGAERVILPYNDLVTVRRRGAYRVLAERGIRANDPLLLSFHPQGTLRMGPDARRGVVNAYGEAHAVRRLFVCDASMFPGSTAVPPLVTVMAFAARTARHLVDNAGAYFG